MRIHSRELWVFITPITVKTLIRYSCNKMCWTEYKNFSDFPLTHAQDMSSFNLTPFFRVWPYGTLSATRWRRTRSIGTRTTLTSCWSSPNTSKRSTVTPWPSGERYVLVSSLKCHDCFHNDTSQNDTWDNNKKMRYRKNDSSLCIVMLTAECEKWAHFANCH